ncbi:MAG: DUF6997 domain-containing protein [Promethearchaeota archaeon]
MVKKLTDFPWKKVLETAEIDLISWERVSPLIKHEVFKELNLQPKNYIPIYSEQERQRKLGTTQNIWPFRTGKGECVLIRGNMSVKNTYQSPNTKLILLEETCIPKSCSLGNSKTEREYLAQGFNSRVFHQLLINESKKEVFLGSAGKLYLNAKVQYHSVPIKLKNVQFELDWTVETRNEVLHFEAKYSPKKPTPEYILFQVFYPTVYLSEKVKNKTIRPFFLDIIKGHGFVDYHFMEIGYDDTLNLSSYKVVPIQNTTIRVSLSDQRFPNLMSYINTNRTRK